MVFLITGGVAFGVTDADFEALQKQVTLLEQSNHYFHVNSTGTATDPNYNNNGAVGSDSMAIGANVSANGRNAMIIGNQSKTVGNDSIVLGKRAGSLGADSIVIGTNAFASDSEDPEDPKKITKKADYDAMTAAQKALYVPLYDDAIGTISKYYKIENPSFAASNVIIGSYSRSFGQNNVSLGEVTKTKGRGATALGFLSEAIVDGSVALGSGSIANRERFYRPSKGVFSNAPLTASNTLGAVSVGYWNSEKDYKLRQIINLADGTEDTDAVNLRQLRAVDDRISSVSGDLKNKIGEVRNEVGHVGSLSAALAALHPMQYDPVRPNQIMAGLGHYRDKQAVAVGVTHYFNQNVMMTAGLSLGNETKMKTMANVGVTWKIGKGNSRQDLPEGYQASTYSMQKEIDSLLKENKEQQSRIDKLEKQVELLLNSK